MFSPVSCLAVLEREASLRAFTFGGVHLCALSGARFSLALVAIKAIRLICLAVSPVLQH